MCFIPFLMGVIPTSRVAVTLLLTVVNSLILRKSTRSPCCSRIRCKRGGLTVVVAGISINNNSHK